MAFALKFKLVSQLYFLRKTSTLVALVISSLTIKEDRINELPKRCEWMLKFVF